MRSPGDRVNGPGKAGRPRAQAPLSPWRDTGSPRGQGLRRRQTARRLQQLRPPQAPLPPGVLRSSSPQASSASVLTLPRHSLPPSCRGGLASRLRRPHPPSAHRGAAGRSASHFTCGGTTAVAQCALAFEGHFTARSGFCSRFYMLHIVYVPHIIYGVDLGCLHYIITSYSP